MTNTDSTALTVPTRQPETKPALRQPGHQARHALDLMVWQGMHRDKAAKAAGMLPKALYNALRKHHVKAYYLAQLAVLRTSELARNHHTLTAVRDQTDNHMARVQAVRTMEQIANADPQSSRNIQQSPGFVIQIITAPGQPEPHITADVTPVTPVLPSSADLEE